VKEYKSKMNSIHERIMDWSVKNIEDYEPCGKLGFGSSISYFNCNISWSESQYKEIINRTLKSDYKLIRDVYSRKGKKEPRRDNVVEYADEKGRYGPMLHEAPHHYFREGYLEPLSKFSELNADLVSGALGLWVFGPEYDAEIAILVARHLGCIPSDSPFGACLHPLDHVRMLAIYDGFQQAKEGRTIYELEVEQLLVDSYGQKRKNPMSPGERVAEAFGLMVAFGFPPSLYELAL
jgi:hypothetical protein